MAFGDFSVVRSTVKRVQNSSGVLASVAINTPAFEFNANGSYRGTSIEPSATNLLLRSQAIGTSPWSLTRITVNATATTAPDSTLTGNEVTVSDIGAIRARQDFTGLTAGDTYSFSVFAKKSSSGNTASILITNTGETLSSQRVINFDTLAITTGAGLNNYPFTMSVIEQPVSGWIRLQCVVTIPAGQTTIRVNTLPGSVGIAAATGANAFFWGAQFETGSLATSYIPTVASTVARGADVVTLTSASSLIGQSANTLYLEGEILTFTGASDACIMALTDGTSDEAIVIRTIAADGKIGGVVRDGGSDQAEITSGSFTTGLFKIAIASAVDDVALYLNGSSVGTDTSATHPALTAFQLGGTVATVAPTARPMWFRAIATFPSRIANASLVTLTT